MRSVLLVAAVSACAAIYACASFGDASSESGSGSGAAGDAATNDSTAGADAGTGAVIVATPGLVACGVATAPTSCNSDAGEACCQEPVGEPSCMAFAACKTANAWTYGCDDPTDCKKDFFCCFDFGVFNSRCLVTCSNDTRMCVTADDCPSGAVCHLYDCAGRVRGICKDLTTDEETKSGCKPYAP